MPQPIRPLLWSRLMVVRCMAKSYKVHSPNKRHAVTAVIYLQVYTWQQFHYISPYCATFSVTNIWRQGVTLKTGIVAFFLLFFCLCIPSDFLINFLVLDFYWLYSYFFCVKTLLKNYNNDLHVHIVRRFCGIYTLPQVYSMVASCMGVVHIPI